MKLLPAVAILSALAVLSCGTEPSEEDVSASVLSLELAGDQTAGYQVTAGWTQCPESSFEGYLLYRSEEPDIEGDLSGAELLGEFTDSDFLQYTDDSVEMGVEYHYALMTLGDHEDFAWSNEDSLEIPLPSSPSPSVLTASVSEDEVLLTWTSCPDGDFFSYTLYRLDEPGIESYPEFATIVYSSQGAADTVFTDSGLSTGDYYYALKTTNEADLYSWSNEEAVTIVDSIPKVQDLVLDQASSGRTVVLAWSPVGIEVDGYEVYFRESESSDWEVEQTVTETGATITASCAGYYSVRAYIGSQYSEEYSVSVSTMPSIVNTTYTIYDNYSPANYHSGIIFGESSAQTGFAPSSNFLQDIYVYDESMKGDLEVWFYSGNYGPFGNGYQTYFQEPQQGMYGSCDPDGMWYGQSYALYPSDSVVFLGVPYASGDYAYVKVLALEIEPEPQSQNGTMVSFRYEYQSVERGLSLFTNQER